MQSQVLQRKMTAPERVQKVREAFKKASPQVKSKIVDLAPNQKSDTDLNVVDFCQWQQFTQWTQ
jgi:hypothetical protein